MHPLLQQFLSLLLFSLPLLLDQAAATHRNEPLRGPVRQHPRQWVRTKIGSVPYGPIIQSCYVPGTVALTFDDGPSSFTPRVLDILSRHSARATFFINGDNYGRSSIDNSSSPWPRLIRRMHAAGHQIGSHTWQHVNMDDVRSATRFEQVIRLEEALGKILGFFPTYFRPPYASCQSACQEDLAELGYHVVNYNVDTKDYEHDSPDAIGISMDAFAAGVSGSPADSSYIVLSHDVYGQTTEALLPFMLKTLLDRGFRAVTVGECLGDPVENWYRK